MFLKARKINPTSLETHRLLGKLFQKRNKNTEAIRFFKKYSKLCDEQSLTS